MIDPREFWAHLDALDVPLFTAAPAGDDYTRPSGWQRLTADGNAARLRSFQPGHAICAGMGGRVLVADVDTKNGADLTAVEQMLNGIGCRVYAKVLTPSGGAHLYLPGHPEVPTVHATADRDGFTGYPGLEIVSYGANVFLPGTLRAKYGGAGYLIAFDHLETLADGGDDDSAEALAAWVAGHRRTTPATFDAAEPWDGSPPDARQAAYLAAALRNQCEQLAAMAPDTGRNNALYLAALKLGNYVAGAGLDEAQAVERLTEAAHACGLVTEDGERSVLATIRSGLRNGRQRPRAVPEAREDTGTDDLPPANVDPATGEVLTMTRDEVHDVFTRWLGVDYDLTALDAVAATVAVERLDGDPVWLLLISGAGNAKTETVTATTGAGAHVTSTLTGEAALLSATSKKDVAKNATGGLLRQLGHRGVLVVKDFTSILSMNRDRRAETLGALREVYDGKWERVVGTDGGRTLTWTGRLVLIGATTTAYDSAHAVIASMGDRFALVRIDSTGAAGRLGSGRQALANVGSEVTMRAELASAFGAYIAGLDPERAVLTEDTMDRLLAAANLVTLARTAVERDYKGNPEWAHAPEAPTRFGKMLGQVVRGSLALGMSHAEALALALRIARDSVPPLRLRVLERVAEAPGSTCTGVTKAIQAPRSTVDRTLQELHLLGLVTVEENSGGGWMYTLHEVDLSVLAPPDPDSVTGNVQPNPQAPKEEGPEEPLSPSPPESCLDISGYAPATCALCSSPNVPPGRGICDDCDQRTRRTP